VAWPGAFQSLFVFAKGSYVKGGDAELFGIKGRPQESMGNVKKVCLDSTCFFCRLFYSLQGQRSIKKGVTHHIILKEI
jgi:hypothetical protein